MWPNPQLTENFIFFCNVCIIKFTKNTKIIVALKKSEVIVIEEPRYFVIYERATFFLSSQLLEIKKKNYDFIISDIVIK